jgi:hypothetical protein
MIDFINVEIKPEAILWTGDSFPHDEWESPKFDDKRIVLDTLTEMFLANLTVPTMYPVIGNHDLEVSDIQDFTELESMINHTMNIWKDWLNEESRK